MLPIRYARYYQNGNLDPWNYSFCQRVHIADFVAKLKMTARNTAVQVLYHDIFSILSHTRPIAVYDPQHLKCLYPREWTDWAHQNSDLGRCVIPQYDEAVEAYNQRTADGDLYENTCPSSAPSDGSYMEWYRVRAEETKGSIAQWLHDCVPGEPPTETGDERISRYTENSDLDFFDNEVAWNICLREWRQEDATTSH